MAGSAPGRLCVPLALHRSFRAPVVTSCSTTTPTCRRGRDRFREFACTTPAHLRKSWTHRCPGSSPAACSAQTALTCSATWTSAWWCSIQPRWIGLTAIPAAVNSLAASPSGDRLYLGQQDGSRHRLRQRDVMTVGDEYHCARTRSAGRHARRIAHLRGARAVGGRHRDRHQHDSRRGWRREQRVELSVEYNVCEGPGLRRCRWREPVGGGRHRHDVATGTIVTRIPIDFPLESPRARTSRACSSPVETSD